MISNGTSYFGNYEILSKVGEGSFGKVYRCKNKFDQQIYAIKKIPQKINQGIKEAQSLAALNNLNGSEHLVKYFTSWYENNIVYIVMEYCKINLQQEMDEKKHFAE